MQVRQILRSNQVHFSAEERRIASEALGTSDEPHKGCRRCQADGSWVEGNTDAVGSSNTGSSSGGSCPRITEAKGLVGGLGKTIRFGPGDGIFRMWPYDTYVRATWRRSVTHDGGGTASQKPTIAVGVDLEGRDDNDRILVSMKPHFEKTRVWMDEHDGQDIALEFAIWHCDGKKMVPSVDSEWIKDPKLDCDDYVWRPIEEKSK